MRKILLAASMAIFSGSLSAQLAINTVIHEPSATDVGPFISLQTVPNPDYNPLQPNGQPQFLPAYGSGKGLSNELDSISPEFYALASTTTHDLAVVTNNSGADIVVDGTSIQVAQIRPKRDVAAAPEFANPGALSINLIPYDGVSFTIQNGTSAAAWVLVIKWAASLDTSPRDYIITFQFTDTATSTAVTVDAGLTVPKVGGDTGNGSGCASGDNGGPQGLGLLAGSGMAAIVVRRRLFQRA